MNLESYCEAAFHKGGPYWHLYTNGEKMPVVFTTPADYAFGILLLGIALACFPNVRILTFSLMSNHLHIILAGPEADIRALFSRFKERLSRYLNKQGKMCRLDNLEAELFRIPDVRTLRSEMVYVNRNGYVVHAECTPFSYWWSAGVFFFNPIASMIPTRPFGSFSLREQREMCHSRDYLLSDEYQLIPDFRPPGAKATVLFLTAPSFCAIQEAESFFRDAHQYFRMLGRDHEAQAEVAQRLKERIFLTDDELYGAVCALSTKEYGLANPVLISSEQKLDLAKRMHYEYNATNKQIHRMLKLSLTLVEELFPKPDSSSKRRGNEDKVQKIGQFSSKTPCFEENLH